MRVPIYNVVRGGLPVGETIPDKTPVATNVSFSGVMYLGEVLTGDYDYSDDFNAEGTSTFKWYRSDDAQGTNKSAIIGATSITYTVVEADQGKYVSFEVTPKDADGTAGDPVESDLVEVVLPEWTAYFDNTRWEPNVNSDFIWDGSKWTFTGTSGYFDMETIGTWKNGYRPTKAKFTFTCTGTIEEFKLWAGGWLYTSVPTSGVEFNLDMGGYEGSDISRFNLVASDGGNSFTLNITNIEFYG